MLKDMPENSTEFVADIPSVAEVAHSKRVIQLNRDQRKRKANIENLTIYIVNENADPNLRTYLQQKQKAKVMLVDKDGNMRGIVSFHSTRMGGHALYPTDIGSDSLAKQLEEFQQFWNFRATKEVVTTWSLYPTLHY